MKTATAKTPWKKPNDAIVTWKKPLPLAPYLAWRKPDRAKSWKNPIGILLILGAILMLTLPFAESIASLWILITH